MIDTHTHLYLSEFNVDSLGCLNFSIAPKCYNRHFLSPLYFMLYIFKHFFN